MGYPPTCPLPCQQDSQNKRLPIRAARGYVDSAVATDALSGVQRVVGHCAAVLYDHAALVQHRTDAPHLWFLNRVYFARPKPSIDNEKPLPAQTHW
jgi:hypothetical protein